MNKERSKDAEKKLYSDYNTTKRRLDHVLSLSSGGAFLGVSVLEVYGAILGWLLTAIYAWVNFNKQEKENDKRSTTD